MSRLKSTVVAAIASCAVATAAAFGILSYARGRELDRTVAELDVVQANKYFQCHLVRQALEDALLLLDQDDPAAQEGARWSVSAVLRLTRQCLPFGESKIDALEPHVFGAFLGTLDLGDFSLPKFKAAVSAVIGDFRDLPSGAPVDRKVVFPPLE